MIRWELKLLWRCGACKRRTPTMAPVTLSGKSVRTTARLLGAFSVGSPALPWPTVASISEEEARTNRALCFGPPPQMTMQQIRQSSDKRVQLVFHDLRCALPVLQTS
jgi:hypothetical protein